MSFGKKGLKVSTASHLKGADHNGVSTMDMARPAFNAGDTYPADPYTGSITDTSTTAPNAPLTSQTRLCIKSDWRDIAISLALILMGSITLNLAVGDVYAEAEWFVIFGVGALFFLGGLVILIDACTGRAKVMVTDQGLINQTIIGDRFIAWDDIEKFSAFSINFNKVAQVKAKPKKLRLYKSTGRINLPIKVLKMKDRAFVNEIISNRPDLVEPTISLMRFVGAKKQAKALLEDLSR